MAARANRVQHDDRTRLKIQTSQLVNRLTDHALGKVDLSQTQVRSIEILLRKTLPDLSQVSGSIHVTKSADEMTDAELAAIAAGRSAGVAAEEDGSAEADSLH